MISVSAAKILIERHCTNFKIVELNLIDALGCVAAESYRAPINTPPFDQSAMDGYAFSYNLWDKKNPLKVVGEVQAGKFYSNAIKVQEAVRIFTGAPIPKDVDTVVVQEKVRVNKNLLIIEDTDLKVADNIRVKGSQAKIGDLVLSKNQLITPVAISYLAGMGFQKLKVFAQPKVGIIVTGKELVRQGEPLQKGQIYESNGIGLHAALRNINIEPEMIKIVDDIEPELIAAVQEMLHLDVIILTGGVSVGNYDLVPAVLEKCGVTKVFHKIKQKPGKPIFFGTHPNGVVFGLPGNPAAVMSCFYQYVQLAIEVLTKKSLMHKSKLPLVNSYSKKAGLTHFLKGKITPNGVEILGGQLSYMLNTFAVADCLVELDEEKEVFEKGTLVDITKFS